MEEELDPNVIKATQTSLGKYVKRPPLTEKLLKKPPFRFLHDIVKSVLKSNNFFEGLFDENELVSENVKDRESKILFLTKVITVLSLTTGQSLSVKPSKVVAGQEPAKTNELLQCLAQALDRHLSSEEAVEQYKNSTKAGTKINSQNDKKVKETINPSRKNTDIKTISSKSTEKLVSNDKDVNKPRRKENTAFKKESPPKKSKVTSKKLMSKTNQETKQNITLEENNKIVPNKIKKDNQFHNGDTENQTAMNKEEISKRSLVPSDEIILHSTVVLQDTTFSADNVNTDSNLTKIDPNEVFNNVMIIVNQEKEIIQEGLDKENDVNSDNDTLINLDNNEVQVDQERNQKDLINNYTSVTAFLKTSVEGTRNPSGNGNAPETKLVDSSNVRPSSMRPSSSRPGAPRLKDKSENILPDPENVIVGKVNIISENTLKEEEEDTSLVFETHQLNNNETQENQANKNLTENQNSHLVQQILDSQKEFSQVTGKTEIEWQIGAQKSQDIFIQEMEKLGYSIQALSRVANPLGKLMDHIQEDVEVMRQELDQWTKIFEDTSKDLQKQKIANEESLLPYHVKIKQLVIDTEEKREKINDLKISIYKNSSRIEKLLASGNVQ